MTLTEELRAGYAPGVPYQINVTDDRVTDVLEQVADRYPKRAALDFFSRATSYTELVNQSRRAATVLKNAGVRPGDRVAMVMPNCPQHIVAVYATMYLGAIVVEHNPLAPPPELRTEFERHGARVVIAWETVLDKLDFLDSSARIFAMDLTRALPTASRALLRLPIPAVRKRRDEMKGTVPDGIPSWDDAVARAPKWAGTCPVGPDDPALLIHTGGTTGVPKAATLSHRNLCANVAQDIGWVPELHEGAEVFDVVLPLFHAFGFSVAFLAGIRMGATLAVFPKFDTTMVATSQRRLPCTFFVGVAPMFERFLNKAEELGVDLTSIRNSVAGAMPLSPELARRWERTTHGIIAEGYGMTEASPIIVGSPVSPLRRHGTLGLPYPSTEIRIVDPEDLTRDVAPGEVGEIIASGPQIFLGYWNRPDETAEVLVDGWLRTGDLGRVDDGFIVMADRRKEMINSSGFNVYPSQVEDAVRSMPGVRDVAVVGLPAGSSGESVVAAVVLEAGASVTLDDVRTWAERSIAHYALPRQIVVMTELPRSQIGKVMRRRVKEEILKGMQATAGLADHAQTAVSTVAAEAAERFKAMREGKSLDHDMTTGPAAPQDRPQPDVSGTTPDQDVTGQTH